MGNSIGGFYAVLFFLLKTIFHGAYWVTLIFVPIATMLTIMTNVAMNNKSGVIGGVAAMLIITLSIPSGETVLYVFARVFETFMGVFVAILVNYDIDRFRNLFEKKKKIMLYFVTLSIDVCIFLDYNRQKEGSVHEGKRISSQYGSFPYW